MRTEKVASNQLKIEYVVGLCMHKHYCEKKSCGSKLLGVQRDLK